MKQTPNYNLPQFTDTDVFNKEDYNDAFSKIDIAINDLQETFNNTSSGGALTTKEVNDARNGKPNLKTRIDEIDNKAIELKATTDELENKKINKTDIINDLITGGSDKPLSAEQGKNINISLNDLIGKNQTLSNKVIGSGNTKICTNAYMIKPEYEGFTGVLDVQTINLPSGFKVGLRHQLTYDNNNHIITLYDTQQNITHQSSYNGTTWTSWARLFNSNGGETNNDIAVVKNDGYVKVKDLSGNMVGMHTNGGNAWLHLFNSNGTVVNGIDLLSSGKVLANGEPVNKKPFVKVYHNPNVTIPANDGSTKNILGWDNLLVSDPPNMGANPGTSANLVAPITGLYQINCTIEVGGGPGGSKGNVKAELSKNNSEFISCSSIVYETGNQTLHLSGSYLLRSGEYVQVHLYNYCNFPITLFNSRRFEMTYIRGWDL